MHSRVKGINEIQATRADLEKKENQTALNTSERKNDEVGIRVSTLRSNEICALFRYYKLCRLIPEGGKFKELAAPFDDHRCHPETLHQLVKLPFEAFVTTNYDRNLDHAWAAVNRKAPRTFELDDGSLKQASFTSEHYIARIHGRTQIPESMITSTEDFSKLDENSSYKDFLLQNILTNLSFINQMSNQAHSNYNSLQTTLTERL